MHSRRLNCLRPFLLSALLLLTTVQAMAQLRLEPARRHVPQQTKSKGSAAGRTQALEPMDLPFWDDFSFTNPLRPTSPNDTLWEKGDHVYVGNGLAINPPTIYAASFDGLDSAGMPYNATDILANGYTDELTSRKIRLSGADKGSTYLTFFFQWKGNGDPPEEADFLSIEFKTEDKWVERTRIYPHGHEDKTVFYDTMLFVAGNDYYHDGFQFRFRSYGRQAGPYDVWNIDYVHLDDGRLPGTRKFRDRALASETRSMLGSYRAVPLVHLVQKPQFNRTYIDLFNLSGVSAVGLSTTAEFTNYYTDQDPISYTEILKDTLGGDILEYQRIPYAYVNDIDASSLLQLSPMPDSIDMSVKVVVKSGDDDDEQNGSVAIPGYDLKLNDTLTSVYRFADYYAYDDGSAEYSVSLITSGNRCLVEFPMLTEDYAYLTGFDVYMPAFGISANQTMDFLIYGPSPGGDGPAKSPTLVFNRTVSGQGLDTFFHVGPIIPAIQVKGRFYVGWLAPSIGRPKVGVDYGNDSGDRIFENTNGIWERNPRGFTSSIMIRPHITPSEPPVVPVIPEVEKGTLTVFPNPCQGACYLRGSYDRLALMNSTGQPVPFEEEALDDRTRISFPTAAPGLYLLRITKGNASRTEKIIVVD